MKNYFMRTMQSTVLIWTTSIILILITSTLYASLRIAGVSDNTSLLIGFATLIGLIVLCLLLFSSFTANYIREEEGFMLQRPFQGWSSTTSRYDQSITELKHTQMQQEATIDKLMQELIQTQMSQQETIDKLMQEQEAQRETIENYMQRQKAQEEIIEKLLEESKTNNQAFLESSYNFNKGTDAYKAGDNALAIEYFLRVLQLQPNNTYVMERLGRAYSNLNNMESAIKYLEDALKIDPQNVIALRSLALCYRYTDQAKAIQYLKLSLDINPEGYEAWDFLGLQYRDLGHFDDAIAAHEKAFSIKQRPETEFYLSILYALKGDKIRARLMALSAENDTLKPENDQRIRPVWKILMHVGASILDDNKEGAVEQMHSLAQYITTRRIYDAVNAHLQLLLSATDHKDWTPEFMALVNKVEALN